MPDFFNNHTDTTAIDRTPNGWGDAFAALPLEAPSGDGWARLARTLDARSGRGGIARRERRTSWLIGLASAAVLALAAWSPLSRWLQAEVAESEPPAVVVAQTVPGQTMPGMLGRPAAPIPTGPDDAQADDAQAAVDRVAEAPVTVSPASREATRPALRKPASKTRAIAARTHAVTEGPSVSRPVPTDSAPPQADANDAIAAAAVDGGDPDPVQKLQAQSAQLEALVALARDERVGNASSELLSSELDAGIAVIDAALSQADLAGAQKQELWQQRVDLLQQLAGVEATSRWLAAQGAASTTTLVAVD